MTLEGYEIPTTICDGCDALGNAIARAAHKAGIYNGEVPLTGAQLLMLCDDLANAALVSQLQQLIHDLSLVPLDALVDKDSPPSARMNLFSILRSMQERATEILQQPLPAPPVKEKPE